MSATRQDEIEALGSTRKFDQHGDWHYFAILPVAPAAVIRSGSYLRNLKSEIENPKWASFTDYRYKPDR